MVLMSTARPNKIPPRKFFFIFNSLFKQIIKLKITNNAADTLPKNKYQYFLKDGSNKNKRNNKRLRQAVSQYFFELKKNVFSMTKLRTSKRKIIITLVKPGTQY